LTYAATVLADSPVGYWPMGESSGTAAVDSSTNANNGAYVNTPTLGRVGPTADFAKAVEFAAASSENLVIPRISAYNIGDVGSLEAWVKTTSAGVIGLLSLGHTSAGSLYMRLNGGLLDFLVSNVADLATSNGSGPFYNDGYWHHMVCTKNGATIKLYVDGQDVTPSTANSTAGNSTENPTIGSDISNGVATDFMQGMIAEVALYSTALSAARVAAHYAAAFAPFVISGPLPFKHMPKFPLDPPIRARR